MLETLQKMEKKMVSKFHGYALDIIRRFQDDEEGLALTEYLILLGLLTAAVITAVALFGAGLANTWNSWAIWVNTLNGAPT